MNHREKEGVIFRCAWTHISQMSLDHLVSVVNVFLLKFFLFNDAHLMVCEHAVVNALSFSMRLKAHDEVTLM